MAQERVTTLDTLAIVFGAGGRLGTRLLPILAANSVTVLGIARRGNLARWPPGMRWMRIDVTNTDEWPRSLGALVAIAEAHHRIVLADLLLDRATVTAMRGSIAAVTAYILRLRDQLASVAQSCSLVAASTTAALAPWLYQTPYGLAKRHQLARYASSGITGTAFLLPSLVDTRVDTERRDGPVWTYHEAALHLARGVLSRQTGARSRDFLLVVPHTPIRWGAREHHRPVHVPHAVARLVAAHASLLLRRHDCPHAHREASHYRLALTPAWLRRQIDHHHAPSILVSRLSRSLNAPCAMIGCGAAANPHLAHLNSPRRPWSGD